MYYWQPYVPVATRLENARREMEKLRRAGRTIRPVEAMEGRVIARSFWGQRWCAHLESFSDFANRLPRGRRYVRNGFVCHLEVKTGRIEAMVAGTEIYEVTIEVGKLPGATWDSVRQRCSGQIGSLLELLEGRLSQSVMGVVADRETGLFPKPGEIRLRCSCPDWARMCKHVAAALYGVGARLDDEPEALFRLRGVDSAELITADLALPGEAGGGGDTLAEDELAGIFGVELDTGAGPVPAAIRRPLAAAAPAAEPRTPAPDPDAFTGSRVAGLRRRCGLSVAGFAARLGVSPATVTRWEQTTGTLRIQARPQVALRALAAETPAPANTGAAADAGSRPPTPLPDHLTGSRVAELRRRCGLSVAGFAARLGVSPATVTRWEQTTGTLRIHTRPRTALRALAAETPTATETGATVATRAAAQPTPRPHRTAPPPPPGPASRPPPRTTSPAAGSTDCAS